MVVNVIGAGLAGCEVAYKLAASNIKVNLYEMKPDKKSPAHKSDLFAELVCSNSLRSNTFHNAVGVLKEELRMLDSLIMEAAHVAQVPAGKALAVDRDIFSKYITDKIHSNPNINVINSEITDIKTDEITIVATGPLTSDDLSDSIKQLFGNDYLYFFDAAAPIISFDSIDFDIAYFKDRYDDESKGSYINCPMTKEEYDNWYEELIKAEVVEFKEFEKDIYFNGCMPFEEIAKKGEKTLLFGPMKPVGLGRGEERPYAVVQLRQDDVRASLYNIVGFQTHLTWGEQKRIIQMIPGLQNANIVRYGVMHRNTFINSPVLLNDVYQAKQHKNLFFAGQITGVEGYIESAASGMLVALNVINYIKNDEIIKFPETTVIGSMAHYVSHCNPSNFQPMNANFGLLPMLEEKHKKKERKELYANRAIEDMKEFINNELRELL